LNSLQLVDSVIVSRQSVDLQIVRRQSVDLLTRYS